MTRLMWKHRRKGALGLVLLLLQRSRGWIPLIILINLLLFIFVLPASRRIGSGLIGRIASLFGVGALASPAQNEYEALMAEARRIRRAHSHPGGSGRGGLRMGADAASGGEDGGRRSSLGLVGKVRGGGEADQDGFDIQAESVRGILRPEEADKRKDGVAVEEFELMRMLQGDGHAGRGVDGAEAGGPGSGAGRGGSLDPRAFFGRRSGRRDVSDDGNSAFWQGARLGKGARREEALAGKPSGEKGGFVARAAGPGDDMLRDALSGAEVPRIAAHGSRRVGGGSLGWRRAPGMDARIARAFSAPNVSAKSTAMYQLAEGKAYSTAAAPPPGKCDPNAGCPNEYASNTGGIVFDGGRTGDGILVAQEIGDPPAPNVPDDGTIATLLARAEQMERDAEACERADEVYGPQVRRKMDEIQELSDKLNAMDCGGGGCSRSKAKKCKRVGDRMRAKCREYNAAAQRQADACPLTSGYHAMDCSQ